MKTAARVIYNHVYLYRDGDVITIPDDDDVSQAGASGRTNKGAANDPLWQDLGKNDSLEIEAKDSEQEIWGASAGGGAIVLQDVIETKRDRTFTTKLEELPAIVFQKLFNTTAAQITNNGNAQEQYNPGAGSTIKGWLKIEQYDQDDNLVNVADVYCHIKVNGNVTFGDTKVQASIACRMLASALNIGVLYPV